MPKLVFRSSLNYFRHLAETFKRVVIFLIQQNRIFQVWTSFLVVVSNKKRDCEDGMTSLFWITLNIPLLRADWLEYIPCIP